MCDQQAGYANHKIILTGFSRGAHAARALTLLITDLGIIQPRGIHEFDTLFKDWIRYRGSENNPDTDARMREIRENPQRAEYIRYSVWVDTCAVFDTVGTMGTPWPWINPRVDQKLGFVSKRIGHVRKAYQAMALDEKRKDFPVNLWEEPTAGQQVRQCWFRGSHSDVGGGGNRFLSNLSLVWMISLIEADPELDILFDTRRLTNLLTMTLTPLALTDSHTGKYKVVGKDRRRPGEHPDTEQIHMSVHLLDSRLPSCKVLSHRWPDTPMPNEIRWYWQASAGQVWESEQEWPPNSMRPVNEERYDRYKSHEKHYLRIMGLVD